LSRNIFSNCAVGYTLQCSRQVADKIAPCNRLKSGKILNLLAILRSDLENNACIYLQKNYIKSVMVV
jgi:hypothetical protein